ncbi:ABC transporter substrate-binding protein [Halodesulfurarchaeum sp.]|uniref:ABC transporter substrate-binding protein n=1 Tax=Halodesulfurarchaeum sp. TaxID=1980530 RepID=UPI002FC30B1B
MPGINDGAKRRSPLSRRRFVLGLGTAGISATLAGCGGKERTETDTPTDDGGPDDTGTPEQIESVSRTTIQELAYITNQTLPVLPIQEKLAQSFQATDDWNVPASDSDKMQVYWPTSWLPRTGDWSRKEGGDEDRLTFAQWAVPEDSQYNVWNGKNDGEARRAMFDRFMRKNLATQEYHPYLISDWEIDGTTVTLTVREGQTWHNGDPVTGKEVANHIKLDLYNSGGAGGLGPYILPEKDMNKIPERVQGTGDRTAKIELGWPVNEDILLSLLAPIQLRAHEGTYGEFVQALDDAETEEERSNALGNLTDFTDPEPVGNGPWKWEDADTQRTLVTKYEGHPDADQIDIPEIEYLYKPKNQGRWQSLINGETDGSATLFVPSNQTQRFPDHMQTSLISRHWGMGIVFNHNKEPVDDPRVRKAIAHVIDREATAKNSGAGTGSKVAVTYPSGLTGEFTGNIEGHWLDGVTDEFDTYGRSEKQTEKAAELLREAGFEKQGGTWQKDGEALELPIYGPAGFSDWVAAAETMVSHLQDFGIKAEPMMQDTSTYWGGTYVEGNYKLALQGWANYDQSHPYFHYDWVFNSGDATDYWNMPSEFEAPILHDQVRDGETVTPTDLISELSAPEE